MYSYRRQAVIICLITGLKYMNNLVYLFLSNGNISVIHVYDMNGYRFYINSYYTIFLVIIFCFKPTEQNNMLCCIIQSEIKQM